MSRNLFEAIHNPDVLNCLANLSNDEVFTPPEIANKMLDMLPKELFENPDTTFLDPACKSGVFLREIAKRLIVGLEKKIPDLQQRIDHIFQKQLFAIAITELTSMLSRRSVYCSKHPEGNYSISKFSTPEGNIRFRKIKHTWKDGKCVFCGASESEYKRASDLETHAYEWIHAIKPEEIFNMKFDVIISNPPYQLSDGGAAASASPLYNLFVEQSKKLQPQYMCMIIPARWYAGGKKLDDFRESMLLDNHIEELHDFPVTDDCFPGVNIRGGVCYFKWSLNYDNIKSLTKVFTHRDKNVSISVRPMKHGDIDIFVRYNESLSILDKIMNIAGSSVMSSIISARKPFGITGDISSKTSFDRRSSSNNIVCYVKGKEIGYVSDKDIVGHKEWVNNWKVFIPRSDNIGTELNDDNLNCFVGKPNEVCSETYIVGGGDSNLTECSAQNMSKYLKTKFARFLHSIAKASQDATTKTFKFIPLQDFSKPWTDAELYAKYKLTKEEIDFIESMIKPMDGGEADE